MGKVPTVKWGPIGCDFPQRLERCSKSMFSSLRADMPPSNIKCFTSPHVKSTQF